MQVWLQSLEPEGWGTVQCLSYFTYLFIFHSSHFGGLLMPEGPSPREQKYPVCLWSFMTEPPVQSPSSDFRPLFSCPFHSGQLGKAHNQSQESNSHLAILLQLSPAGLLAPLETTAQTLAPQRSLCILASET